MKRRLFILMTILLPLASWAQFGMTPPTEDDKVSGAAQLGAITADGENWQQVAFRMDLPIWKFGVGLDVQLLFNAEGQVRTADWDEWEDYLDKVYYVRYGKKNKDPFYIKFGSLDYATIGYGNIVDNYTNMIEYPTYRRWGSEVVLKTEKLGVELLMNDYKELGMSDPGMMLAGRVSYKPVGKLQVGVSAAMDFNEYNGLRDTDGDGVPDRIDDYEFDDKYAARRDYYVDEFTAQGISDVATQEAIISIYNNDENNIDKIGDYTGDQLFNKNTADPSTSLIYSIDIGYPLIDGEATKLEVFSHYTKIQDKGWGITAPGLRFSVGKFLTIKAEYRQSTENFMFGYINSSYDLERAILVPGTIEGTNIPSLVPFTKKESLDTEQFNSTFNGYLAGADFRIGEILQGKIEYQDLIGADGVHVRTLKGSAGLQADFIPMIKSLNGYYLQNNVQDFSEWKTPQTVMGLIFDYNVGGVTMGIDYRLTFQDRDGDGLIRGSEETLKTMSFRTRVAF